MRKKVIYENGFPTGIKFSFGDPTCDFCGTTDMPEPLYSFDGIDKITVCGLPCADKYCKENGMTYDLDCACNNSVNGLHDHKK